MTGFTPRTRVNLNNFYYFYGRPKKWKESGSQNVSFVHAIEKVKPSKLEISEVSFQANQMFVCALTHTHTPVLAHTHTHTHVLSDWNEVKLTKHPTNKRQFQIIQWKISIVHFHIYYKFSTLVSESWLKSACVLHLNFSVHTSKLC